MKPLLFWGSLVLLPAWAGTPPPILDPNATEWPASSLRDVSYLLDAPAGKHGFLGVQKEAGGRFVFEDGTPARFWGINVAVESVFQPHERIDAAVAALARAGFNLVRLHHVDDTRGLLDPTAKTSQVLRSDRLEKLDYWIARLKERGLYVYLDLLDYRTFTPADGVAQANELGRGAKPYAVFDPRLIELQQRYARQLLREHINPYTGLAYADDPAVALVELFDENGLFIKRDRWPHLVGPYRARLQALWNDYLREVHGSTEGLRRNWTRPDGSVPLGRHERLENGTVELPRLELAEGPSRGTSSLSAEPRLNDAARFAYMVHTRYYRTMRAFLRQEVGLRVPLTAVGASDILPDLKAVADELDFIGLNFYWDHPRFPSGRDWQMPFFFTNQNPLQRWGEWTFMPTTTLARVADRPLVIREWSYCYPNAFRATGMLEAVAYACLQDFDALILFTYGLRNDSSPIGCFDVRRDPARWGLAALGAEVFLRRAVAPARRSVEIGYSDVDTFRFFRYFNDLYQLGWVSHLANRFFPQRWQASADLTVASGRSTAGQYLGGPALLFSRDEAVNLYGTPSPPLGTGAPIRSYFGYTLVRRPVRQPTLIFDGWLHPPGTRRQFSGSWLFSLAHLQHLGLEPIGVAPEAEAALGFRDAARSALVFAPLTPEGALRAALDALGRIEKGESTIEKTQGRRGKGEGVGEAEAGLQGKALPPISHRFVDQRVFVSDTGELVRDAAAGRLTVATPTLWAVAGNLGPGGWLRAGDLAVSTPNPAGVVAALSCDGRPLTGSRHYVLKMVTTAANTGQDWLPPQTAGNDRPYWRLGSMGRAPVITGGQASSIPTLLHFAGQRLLEVYLRGGTFELERDGSCWRFYCDTPGIRFALPAAPTRMLTYPAGARWVEVGEP